MAADEEIRLVMSVLGQDKAADLRREAERLRQEMVKLGASVAANDPQMLSLASRMKTCGDAADDLEKKFGRGGGGAKGFGQTIQATGRIVQDFVAAGIGGIVNNLEQMGAGFAASAGKSTAFGAALGGAFQLVGVILQVAMPHIMRFFESFSGTRLDPFKRSIENLQEKIEALKKSEFRFSTDRTELDAAEAQLKRLIKAQETFDSLSGRKTRQERASEAKTGEIIDEAGAGGVRAALKKASYDELVKRSENGGEIGKNRAKIKEDEDRNAEIEEKLKHPMAAEERESLELEQKNIASRVAGLRAINQNKYKEYGAEAEKNAGELLTPGEAGKVGEKQELLAKGLEKAGRRDLAARIRRNTPAEMKAAEARKEALDLEDRDLSQQDTDAQEAGGKIVHKLAPKLLAGSKNPGIASYDKAHDDDVMATARASMEAASPGSVISDEAVREAVRIAKETVDREIADIVGTQNVAPERAREMVRKKHLGVSDAVRLEAEAKNQAENTETDESQRKQAEAKAKEQADTLGRTDLVASADALYAQARAVLPMRGQSKSRVRELAKDQVDQFIRQDTYRRLIREGAEPGKAEEMANAAPKFYQEQLEKQRLDRIGRGNARFGDEKPGAYTPVGLDQALGKPAPGMTGYRSIGVGPPAGPGASKSDQESRTETEGNTLLKANNELVREQNRMLAGGIPMRFGP